MVRKGGAVRVMLMWMLQEGGGERRKQVLEHQVQEDGKDVIQRPEVLKDPIHKAYPEAPGL